MIEPVKKKLSIIFLATTFGFIVFILLTVYFFMNYRLTQGIRDHLVESINTEFMPHYRNKDLDVLSKIVEDELFQVLDRNGNVVLSVQSSVPFNPTLNESLFSDAAGGSQVFETISHNNRSYLLSYYPLDKKFIGRAVHSIESKEVFQKNFMILVLFSFPLLVLLAYILSRYMVGQSLKPISHVLKYQETYSSNLSHELKSPLTSIKGTLEVALRRDRSSQEYRETLKSALHKVDGISDLLNNLGLIASSKFKSLDLYRERVNISKVIEEIVEKYEPIIYRKSVTLNLSVSGGKTNKGDISLVCDVTLMRRAIENLVDNSVKYSPEAGVIVINSENDKDFFSFRISNTCSDLRNEDLKKLSEPFYRGDKSREKLIEGKGLGLHVVKYIAYSHGGTLVPQLTNGTFIITMKIPHASPENFA